MVKTTNTLILTILIGIFVGILIDMVIVNIMTG